MNDFVSKYPEATFNWCDLSSGDIEGSKQFYSALFGWEVEERPIPGGSVYIMFRLNGRPVAGAGPMPEAQAGHHAYWSSYVSVSDVDAMTAKATEAGATLIMPPMDVMEEGRMSVVNDPTGAYIGLWQAKNHIGAELVNIPNTVVWNELMTRDVDAAMAFYTVLFGWTADNENGYSMVKNGDRAAGGIGPMPEYVADDVIPAWNVMFLVSDIATSVAKAESLGASILMPITQVDGDMQVASIRDPQGGAIQLLQATYVDPMP